MFTKKLTPMVLQLFVGGAPFLFRASFLHFEQLLILLSEHLLVF